MVGTQPDAADGDAPGSQRWGHGPALDGVRGVAVVAVLLFHGGVSWAKGGFLGVDAFFVLSGLLITSLLLDECADRGRVDLGRFWSRRARRLLPALLAVVAAAGVYGALEAPRGSLASLRKDAIATLFYVANWRYIQAGANYFEATAAPSVLRHTWSLAIEEQFYMAWPLVMFVIARFRAPHLWTAMVAGAGVLASAAAMWVVFEPGADVSRAYFGTDTRVQVVLTGCLLAAVLAAIRRRRSATPVPRAVAASLGIAALVGSLLFLAATATVEGTEPRLFRGGFLVVSLAVAAVLAHIVLVPGGWSARLLSWTPLRAVGLVSYGLYLWHWPVYLTLTHARTGLEGAALLGAKLTVTALLSVASYVLIERPIRRGALPGLRVVVAATLATAIAAAVVVVGTELPPLERPASAAERTASGFPVSSRPTRAVGEPSRVLVVGDSVAKTLADRLVRPARAAGLELINRGVLGCGVVRGGPFRYFGDQQNTPSNCASWPQQWEGHISRYDPDVVLLTVGRWEVMDRVHNGTWTQLGDPVFDAYIESELERAVEILTVGSATVAMTTAPYFLRGERPDGGQWPEDDPARVDRFNAILRTVAARHAERVAIVDLNAQTARDGRYTPVIDGVEMRYDGVHFSPAGAAWLAPWLIGALVEMSPPESSRAKPGPTITTDVTTTIAPRPTAPPTTRAPTTTTAPPPPPTTAAPTTTAPPETTTTASPLPTLPGRP